MLYPFRLRHYLQKDALKAHFWGCWWRRNVLYHQHSVQPSTVFTDARALLALCQVWEALYIRQEN